MDSNSSKKYPSNHPNTLIDTFEIENTYDLPEAKIASLKVQLGKIRARVSKELADNQQVVFITSGGTSV